MVDNVRWVTRLSSRGNPYQVLEQSLPRVDDEILQTIVYLYPSEEDAHAGSRLGGTGFLIGVPVPFQTPAVENILCIVTNKHVVQGGSTTVRLNDKSGGFEIIELDNAKWYYHPDGDDLCLCPVRIGANLKQVYLPIWSVVNKALAQQLDIGIGDDVFFAGRFTSLDGKQQNRPSIRFGNIAQMPDEPVLQSDGTQQESIIVEARSIPGFSGSPVFFYMMPEPTLPPFSKEIEELIRPGRFFNKKRWPSGIQVGPYVIGVDYCNIFERDPVVSDATGEQMHDWNVRSNTGMMGVVPSWKIWEIVEGKEMAKLREDVEKILRKKQQQSNVNLNSGAAPATSEPSDRNPNHREDFRSLLDAAAKTQQQDD